MCSHSHPCGWCCNFILKFHYYYISHCWWQAVALAPREDVWEIKVHFLRYISRGWWSNTFITPTVSWGYFNSIQIHLFFNGLAWENSLLKYRFSSKLRPLDWEIWYRESRSKRVTTDLESRLRTTEKQSNSNSQEGPKIRVHAESQSDITHVVTQGYNKH